MKVGDFVFIQHHLRGEGHTAILVDSEPNFTNQIRVKWAHSEDWINASSHIIRPATPEQIAEYVADRIKGPPLIDYKIFSHYYIYYPSHNFKINYIGNW